jgi:hypothetical protein
VFDFSSVTVKLRQLHPNRDQIRMFSPEIAHRRSERVLLPSARARCETPPHRIECA